MAKYHTYSAATSDGKERVNGYSHKQMMKFVSDKAGLPSPWLIEQKFDTEGQPVLQQKLHNGKPVTIAVTHEWEEIDFQADAQARGLQAVRSDEKGVPKHTEDKPYVKTYGVIKVDGKLRIGEMEPEKPKTVEQLAAEAEQEVAALERQAAEAKARLAALKKK